MAARCACTCDRASNPQQGDGDSKLKHKLSRLLCIRISKEMHILFDIHVCILTYREKRERYTYIYYDIYIYIYYYNIYILCIIYI